MVAIDVDLQRGSLVEQCRDLAPFDYAVASHVFEHLPNPVGWLRDVAALLVPRGVIALAVPDRRFTFDFFRRETTAARILGRAVGGKHVDCHCSVWTRGHFARVIPDALRLREVPLRIRRLDEPLPGTNEFLVHLERL